ncbi:hypothetical protein B0H34DRAFT_801323 [Crassisporium funariophilum]|nr:hypothetical protein B0H34DRAFT_801323 [Crassisporium funariophilum]
MPLAPEEIALGYQSSEPVAFLDFKKLEDHIHVNRLGDSMGYFKITGETVADAALNLIEFVKSANQDHSTPMTSMATINGDQKVYAENGQQVTLSNMFRFHPWTVRAQVVQSIFECVMLTTFHCSGGANQFDVTGGGVMREVLMEAVNLLVTHEAGIAYDLSNDDSYLSLRVSDFVSESTLNSAFTLGVICAMFMIKAHAGPDPVSPSLLQAAIGGVESIVNFPWVHAANKQAAQVLALLPVDAAVPIPDNQDLNFLFQSRIPNCRFSDIRTAPSTERQTIQRALYIHTLLGTSQRAFAESKEFQAFQNGLNLYIGGTTPSLIDALQSSSKHLLAQSYARRIHSPFQIMGKLCFAVKSRNEEFMQEMETKLPDVELAVKRYLLGSGHPFPQRVAGLLDADTLARDRQDTVYRAQRLVKVMTGLSMLPPAGRTLLITIRDDVATMGGARFGTSYDLEGDLLPPISHSCLYELELLANRRFMLALGTSNVPLGEDTEFDWVMHMGVMELGSDGYNA